MKSLFASQIQKTSLKINRSHLESMLQTCLNLPKIDHVGVQWSKKNYQKGYTSYSSIANLHEQFSIFDQLKTKLDQQVKIYVKSLGLKFDTGSLELSTLWANVMPKDCYHAFHHHPLSVVSGTFYLSVDAKTSPIRFEDPRASLFMACPARKIQYDIKPKNGDVVLFESWMKHEVPPHQSNSPRVSISFNYDWFNR